MSVNLSKIEDRLQARELIAQLNQNPNGLRKGFMGNLFSRWTSEAVSLLSNPDVPQFKDMYGSIHFYLHPILRRSDRIDTPRISFSQSSIPNVIAVTLLGIDKMPTHLVAHQLGFLSSPTGMLLTSDNKDFLDNSPSEQTGYYYFRYIKAISIPPIDSKLEGIDSAYDTYFIGNNSCHWQPTFDDPRLVQLTNIGLESVSFFPQN